MIPGFLNGGAKWISQPSTVCQPRKLNQTTWIKQCPFMAARFAQKSSSEPGTESLLAQKAGVFPPKLAFCMLAGQIATSFWCAKGNLGVQREAETERHSPLWELPLVLVQIWQDADVKVAPKKRPPPVPKIHPLKGKPRHMRVPHPI